MLLTTLKFQRGRRLIAGIDEAAVLAGQNSLAFVVLSEEPNGRLHSDGLRLPPYASTSRIQIDVFLMLRLIEGAKLDGMLTASFEHFGGRVRGRNLFEVILNGPHHLDRKYLAGTLDGGWSPTPLAGGSLPVVLPKTETIIKFEYLLILEPLSAMFLHLIEMALVLPAELSSGSLSSCITPFVEGSQVDFVHYIITAIVIIFIIVGFALLYMT